MNKEIKILSQTNETRCSICHQSDYFHPETNSCSRCEAKNLYLDNRQAEIKKNKNTEDPFIQKVNLITGKILIFIFSITLIIMMICYSIKLIIFVLTGK